MIGISILFVFGVFLKYGCGDPKTEKYAPAPAASDTNASGSGSGSGAGSTTGATPEDCQTHFDSNIAPAVVASCSSSSCHGAESSAPVFSVSGGGAAARTALKTAFSDKAITNDTTYTAVLGTGGSFSSHPGGSVASSSQLTPALVKAWLECEAAG